MTRAEALAIIATALPALDETQDATVAELAQSFAQSSAHLSLTDTDRADVAAAREDFATGRAYSSGEARAMTAAFLAKRRGVSPSS
jgi:hypothetical protein